MATGQGDSHTIHQDQQTYRSPTTDTPEEQVLVIPQDEADSDEESLRGARFLKLRDLVHFFRRFSPVLVPLPFALLIYLLALPFMLQGHAYLRPIPLLVLFSVLIVMQGIMLYYAGYNDAYWTIVVIIGYSLFIVFGTLAIFGIATSFIVVA